MDFLILTLGLKRTIGTGEAHLAPPFATLNAAKCTSATENIVAGHRSVWTSSFSALLSYKFWILNMDSLFPYVRIAGGQHNPFRTVRLVECVAGHCFA